MVGGKVIAVDRVDPGVRLWCMDYRHSHDECAVHVPDEGDLPECGDDIWWQAGKVYWTPKDRRFEDKPLTKLGYSYEPKDAPAAARTQDGGDDAGA